MILNSQIYGDDGVIQDFGAPIVSEMAVSLNNSAAGEEYLIIALGDGVYYSSGTARYTAAYPEIRDDITVNCNVTKLQTGIFCAVTTGANAVVGFSSSVTPKCKVYAMPL